MPRYIKINVNFQTADDDYVPPIRRYDHRIGIHPAARQSVLREWHLTQSDPSSRDEAARLTAELVEYWMSQAAECSRAYRHLAAIAALREALLVDDSPATRQKLHAAVAVQAGLDAAWADALHLMEQKRFAEAGDALRKILEVKPDLARAHGKLGAVYAVTGQPSLAAGHLEAVARHDPDDAYGESMLGWLDYLGGRAGEALEHFRRADRIEPFDAPIHHKIGLALVRLDRPLEAVEQFKRTLEIDPNHVDSCVELSALLREQNRPEEALDFARRATRLSGDRDPNVLLALAQCYLAVGRWGDAERAADQAVDAAEKADPQAMAQIRARAAILRTQARRSPK